MALAPILPKPSAPVVTASGLATTDWFEFFRLLRIVAGDNVDAQAQIAALEARVLALEEAQGADAEIQGPYSVRVQGSLADGLVRLLLDGDENDPGGTYFYGTGPDGTKGFHAVADAVLGDDSVVQDVDAATGVVTFHLDGDVAAPGNGYVYSTHLTTGVKGWNRPALFESTGLLDGGTLSINAGDNTKFDVAAAIVGYTDYTTNPAAPERHVAQYGPTTGNSVPSLAVVATYVGVQTPGSILVTSSSPFTPTQRRTIVPLGAVIANAAGTALIAVNNLPDVMRAGINQYQDLLEALGPINRSGNVFGPNGANLQLNKSAGTLFKQGSNFHNNEDDPHNLALASLTAPSTMQYRTSTGTASANTNSVDVTQYESAPGVLSVVPNNRFTIQRITLFTSNLVRIQYGQHVYQTMAEAEASLVTESFTTEQNIAENGALRCFMIVKKNATNLSDATEAKFIPASKFGGPLGSGGTSITTTDSLPEGVTNLYYTPARVAALINAQDYLAQYHDTAAGLLRMWGINPYATYVVDSAGNYLRDSSGNLLTTDNDGFPIPQAFGGTGTATAGTSAQFLAGGGWTNTLTGMIASVGDGGGQGGFDMTRYSNDAGTAGVRSFKARGSLAVPAAVQSGDGVASIQGRGYHSGGAFGGNVGVMELQALEGFTSGAQGTFWNFEVTPIGSTTRTSTIRIESAALRPATDNAYANGTAAARWSQLHTVNSFRYGAIFDTGTVSPAQITANTDNWAVTGLGSASTIRASTDASRNLTGIASPTAGQRVALFNVGTQDLVLVHDATSTAANRFLCPGSVNLTLNPNDGVTLWYDSTSSRWRVVGT